MADMPDQWLGGRGAPPEVLAGGADEELLAVEIIGDQVPFEDIDLDAGQLGWLRPAGLMPPALLEDALDDELAALHVAPTYIWPEAYGRNLHVLRCNLLDMMNGETYEQQRAAGFVTSRVVRQDGSACYVELTASTYLPRAFWHWWINGRYAGRTLGNNRIFRCPPGRSLNVHARPMRYDKSYDGATRVIDPLSGELTVEWLPSAAAGVTRYRVQYRISGAGTWTDGPLVHAKGQWPFTARIAAKLADDTLYELQVVPYDTNGNAGTPLSLGSTRVVRWPDPPDPAISLDGGQQWTVDEV